MPYLARDNRGRYSQLLEKRDLEWKLYVCSLAAWCAMRCVWCLTCFIDIAEFHLTRVILSSHSSFIHWGGLKIYDKDKVKGEIFLYSWIISLFSYSCIAAWCRAESYQMLSRQFSLISHFQILTHFSFSRFHSRLRKLWFLALKPFPYLRKMRFLKNLQLAKSCFNVKVAV